MTLVACFVTPHPPVMIPEVGRDRLDDVRSTFEAMGRLADDVGVSAPDVVVLMSPHAPLERGRMGVSLAERYVGSFGLFGVPEVSLRLDGAPDLARAIVAECEARGLPVRGSHEGRTAELDHGALTPLTLLLRGATSLPALVVLSFSYLDPEAHVEFGRAVGTVVREDERRILYVASGDLSHRLIPGAPAGYSPRGAEFDAQVVEAFEADDLSRLRSIPREVAQEAGECGLRSLITLEGVVEGVSHHSRLLSYEGPFGVGYLVGAVDVPAGAPSPDPERREPREDALVALARQAVETVVRGGRPPEPDPIGPDQGPARAGVFVSLHLPDGSLRGCVGTFEPTRRTLAEEVVGSAVGAATRDPRFLPVRPNELEGLRLAVDVLEEPEDIEGVEQLDPSRYGVIVRTDDGRQALLLPDLEGVDTAEKQLSIVCRKGHIDPRRDRYRLQRFRVTRHGTH